jgi:hypothetical protein
MKRFLIIALAAVFALAFAACGERKPAAEEPTAAPAETAPAEQPTEAPTEAPTEQPTEAATDAPAADVEAKVAEYVEMLEPQIDALAEQLADVMELSCFAEGNAVVLQYKFLSADQAVDADTLKASLDASGASYITMFRELADFAGTDDVRVMLRYIAADGSKILDYAVDKNYTTDNGQGFQTHYDSLEEFVASEEFNALIDVNTVPGVETSAFVEDGFRIVYLQKLSEELSEEDLETFRTAWLSGMEQTGDLSAQAFVTTIRLVVDIDEIEFVYRVVDNAGELIAEYKAELD